MSEIGEPIYDDKLDRWVETTEGITESTSALVIRYVDKNAADKECAYLDAFYDHVKVVESFLVPSRYHIFPERSWLVIAWQ